MVTQYTGNNYYSNSYNINEWSESICFPMSNPQLTFLKINQRRSKCQNAALIPMFIETPIYIYRLAGEFGNTNYHKINLVNGIISCSFVASENFIKVEKTTANGTTHPHYIKCSKIVTFQPNEISQPIQRDNWLLICYTKNLYH